MVNNANWLLPEGVEEILPEEAHKLEMLRRSILDDLASRGFQLVMPPVMEFVDALLTGTGKDLDTQTYKFMDQHTNRMLGIRADITPQIARIDSHYLADQDVNRLCYAGTVLRTRPDQMGGQRELLQIGAEVFGIADESADIQVIEAMLKALALCDANSITLSVGHVGVYRALLDAQSLDGAEEQMLRDVLMRKSLPDLAVLSDKVRVSDFQTLIGLQGDVGVLKKAHDELPDTPEIRSSLEQLKLVITHIENADSDINVHVDLADVQGYGYHTSLKYSAYVSGRGRSVARGGRYDRIGQEFGRPRSATGFSADLKTLVKLG